MKRCIDCEGRLRGTHYIDYRFDGAVCEGCVAARRERDGPDTWWWGMQWQRDVPNVLPIVLGTYCICACIIALILLAKS